MPKLRLLTISVSHYCEKARWALDRAGLSYVERRYLPLAHLVPVWLAGAGHMVPVLLEDRPKGRQAIPDSTAILKHIDTLVPGEQQLYPADQVLRAQVDSLEETFDQQLGPATRRWAYFHLLPEQATTLRPLRRTLGWLGRVTLPLLFPLVRRFIRVGYRINPDSAARSYQKIQTVFQQVNELLQDGRRYLVGGRFSAADLTFAALSVPVLFPTEARAPMPALDELPAEMARAVDSLRRSPAGDFALRMYREHRAPALP